MNQTRTPNRADTDILESKLANATAANSMKRRLALLSMYARNALEKLCLAEEAMRAASSPSVVTPKDILASNGAVLDPRKQVARYDQEFKTYLGAACEMGVELAESCGVLSTQPAPELKLAGADAGE